jgi:hypothetical protein
LCDTVVWARGVLNGPTDEEKQAMQNRAGRPYQGALAAPAEHGPLGLAFGTA